MPWGYINPKETRLIRVNHGFRVCIACLTHYEKFLIFNFIGISK